MPIFLLILCCALWGLSFPLMKALHLEQSARMAVVSSVFLASWLQLVRFGLGFLMLAPFVLRKDRMSRLEVQQGLLLAFYGGMAMWIQADALAYTDASVSAFLTQAYCVLLPLWACLRSKQWPSSRVVVATVLVVIGGAILSGVRLGALGLGRGELETLAAAFLFTFQILTLEAPQYRKNRGLSVTVVMFGGVALMFLPITWFLAPSAGAMVEAGASLPCMMIVFTLALLCSVVAYSLMNIWQPFVTATDAGLIYTMEPMFATAYVLFLPSLLGEMTGVVYANEVWTLPMFVGGFLVVAANGIMQWRRPAHLPAVGPF